MIAAKLTVQVSARADGKRLKNSARQHLSSRLDPHCLRSVLKLNGQKYFKIAGLESGENHSNPRHIWLSKDSNSQVENTSGIFSSLHKQVLDTRTAQAVSQSIRIPRLPESLIHSGSSTKMLVHSNPQIPRCAEYNSTYIILCGDLTMQNVQAFKGSCFEAIFTMAENQGRQTAATDLYWPPINSILESLRMAHGDATQVFT